MSTSLRRRWFLMLVLIVAVATLAQAQDHPEKLYFEKLDWEQSDTQPDAFERLEQELARQRIRSERDIYMHNLFGARSVSQKSRRYLSEQGLGPARLRAPLADVGTKAGADTLRILLVRIGFETNREPGLVTMAADGGFFIEPREPASLFDPEPHDKAFFESHMDALGQYYHFQSGGRLHVESRVLPDGDQDFYSLSDIADYGPGAGAFWTLEGLESLVQDMITTADAGALADGVNLADFDDDDPLTYIIFAHAGSDWQSDVNQDSPNDIPTFFVTLGEAVDLASTDSQTGLPGALTECSVIPETTTQDGYMGSIAAALYHEFGHALGLPDVYNAVSGYTQCGVWDIMDSGTNLAVNVGLDLDDDGEPEPVAVSGLLPPSMSAWSKWFLGWVTTKEITGGEPQDIKLPAVGVPLSQYAFHNQVAGNDFNHEDPQVLIGGAGGGEFFLVENRWVPFSVADTPYDNAGDLFFTLDHARDTGVVLFLGGEVDGTIYNTGYYDYFLPDGGLLVWHANMNQIEVGLANNTINQYGNGLRVVEADGIQDIGVLDAYVLGWYGSASDVFAPWNTSGYDYVSVSEAGRPNSRAFDRALTGVKLWDIDDDGSSRGAVMRLKAVLEGVDGGWPVALPPTGTVHQPAPRGVDQTSLTAVAWTGDQDAVLAASLPEGDDPALLFAWDALGQPVSEPVGSLPEGAVLELPAAVTAPPVALSDGSVLLGTADGAVHRFEPASVGMTAAWSSALADTILTGPVALPLDAFFVLDGAGRAHLLDADGDALGSPVELMIAGEVPAVAPRGLPGESGTCHLLLVQADGFRLLEVDDAGFTGQVSSWMGRIQGQAQVACLPDGDDTRLILWDETGLVGCWLVDAAGAMARDDWPEVDAHLVGEPAVADLDGDGRLDVVALTGTTIHAWQTNGVTLTGYPRRLADLITLGADNALTGSPVVANLSDGPGNELACLTSKGHLLVLGADALLLDGESLRVSDGASALLAVPHDGALSLAVASRGGLRGEPRDERLTHGRLVLVGEHAQAAGGTAGWYGLGGGSLRQGTVGTAAPVTDDPQIAAAAQNDVVYYPSPITGNRVSVRYYSASDRPAELVIYNLSGELVLEASLQSEADRMNEHTLELDVASGLYVARLVRETAAGSASTEVRTLAVAR